MYMGWYAIKSNNQTKIEAFEVMPVKNFTEAEIILIIHPKFCLLPIGTIFIIVFTH